MVRINLLAVTIVHLGFASAGMLAKMIRQDRGLCQFVASRLGYLAKNTTLADNGVTEIAEAAGQAMLEVDMAAQRAAVYRQDASDRRHPTHEKAHYDVLWRRHLHAFRWYSFP